MSKKFSKIRYIPIVLFIGAVIFSFVNSYFKSRTVHFEKYDFVITKVTDTPTGTAIPFQNDIKMDMQQYIFFPNRIIKVGDSIHKGAEEKYLYIFRRDETKNFILIDSIEPTGLYSWNYKP
ncbi:hypothetical protein IRZ71_07700 [Flavobacterium sp. ANB]|uniref:hypothetical protein n=1 Tax=unclassified Flavobacterium TaxID=196869 RepID=UPI0012B7C105|nr:MULTISPECIES: hypothetical protein [unclassified Flavobacterium]MBF4516220.1 hypothetical protein [Flavobacterium sp. ANB]MTD69883.1 hypothetical protein [Flavobacterium sp. LC2016-13]